VLSPLYLVLQLLDLAIDSVPIWPTIHEHDGRRLSEADSHLAIPKPVDSVSHPGPLEPDEVERNLGSSGTPIVANNRMMDQVKDETLVGKEKEDYCFEKLVVAPKIDTHNALVHSRHRRRQVFEGREWRVFLEAK